MKRHLYSPGRRCFCDRLEMVVSRDHFLADVCSKLSNRTSSILSLKNVTLLSSYTAMANAFKVGERLGLHGGEYENYCLLGSCDAVWWKFTGVS